MKLKEGIIVSIKFKNTNEINGMIRDMKDLQMKDLESRRKKFCTIIEHGNLLTITNNHMIFSFVWLDVWESTDILSKIMHISSVKEPGVIAWNGRRCKHSLHLGVIVVGRFMNSSRVVSEGKFLKINIKLIMTTYNNVTELST